MSKNNHKILNCGQKRTFAWWSKGKKGKKGWSKGNKGVHKGGFRPYQPEKTAGKDYTENKDKKERTRKARARKEFSLNLDVQTLKHSMKKDMAMLGNLTTGLPAIGLTIP